MAKTVGNTSGQANDYSVSTGSGASDADTQRVILATDQPNVPVTASAGTNLNTSALALDATLVTTNTEVGGLTEAAPATDTASSGLNGRLQRIAQRLTSLIALLPASLGQKVKASSLAVTLASDQDALPITDNSGSLTVDQATGTNLHTVVDSGSVSVSGTVTVDTELPAAAALADGTSNPTTPLVGAQLELFNGTTWDRVRGDITNGIDVDVTRVGGNVTVVQGTGTNLHTVLDSGTLTTITNVVHVDDNAGSLTVDSPQLPSGLVGGRLDDNVGSWMGSTAPTVGQKTSANSLPVTISSDQTTFPVSATISGTVTTSDAGLAVDAAATQPSTNLMSGWDGLAVRSANIQKLDGVNTLLTHDNQTRRLLEQVIVELRVQNSLLSKLVPGLQQADVRGDLSLAI